MRATTPGCVAAPEQRDPRDRRILEVSEERRDPLGVEHEDVRVEEEQDVARPLRAPSPELDDVERLE